MATQLGPSSYDSANSTVRREESRQVGPSSAANAVAAIFQHYQATRLKAIHFQVHAAGTGTTAGVRIKIGTSSVGAFTPGTGTVGLQSSIVLNTDLAAMARVSLENIADATLCLAATFEHEVLPGPTQTQ